MRGKRNQGQTCLFGNVNELLEVEKAIGPISDCKAAGLDLIPGDILKLSGKFLEKTLGDLVTKLH